MNEIKSGAFILVTICLAFYGGYLCGIQAETERASADYTDGAATAGESGKEPHIKKGSDMGNKLGIATIYGITHKNFEKIKSYGVPGWEAKWTIGVDRPKSEDVNKGLGFHSTKGYHPSMAKTTGQNHIIFGLPRYKTIHMRVTAYCPCEKCCGEWADGYTASGRYIMQGDRFVAADKRYAFGTEMIIEGYNDNDPVEVLGRGGAIKGDRLDVFFNTHDEALQWGVQYIDVKIKIQVKSP